MSTRTLPAGVVSGVRTSATIVTVDAIRAAPIANRFTVVAIVTVVYARTRVATGVVLARAATVARHTVPIAEVDVRLTVVAFVAGVTRAAVVAHVIVTRTVATATLT